MSEISITDPKIETRGIYGDGYEINLSAYEGIDTSRLAVVFSGQGSARPGMFLEEYQRLPAMKQHFAIADKMAADRGLPAISSFILDAAKLEGETLCKVRNLAIFTAQIACYEAIIEAGLRPIVVSGFSQGEVAALVASGIASFTDGFKILCALDRVSSPPNSLGYMMAVAASPDRLQQILDPKTYLVSCIGAPEQITISIRPEHVDQVTKILKQHDILIKLLDIPQPYHTELMRPVSDRIHSFLQSGQIRFKTPALPMVSCISHRVIDAHNCRNTDWVEIMSRQTTEKVDFVGQIQIIRSFRCGSFLEIGPGRSLQNFIAATLKQQPHRIIELSKVLLPRTEKNNTTKEVAFASNPLLKILQRAIAKVTGYQIERISLEDRFQEDLGVDSLKTAEIILQVMKESGRNLDPARSISGFKDVHSAVEMLEKAPIASYDLKPVHTARFMRGRTVWRACPLEQQSPVVFVAQASLTIEFQQIVTQTVSPAELADRIAAMPARPLLVIRADKPELPFQKALLPTDTRGFLEQTARIIEFFQKILQILPEPNFDLFLVTSQQSGPLAMALPGLLWCLRREFPGLFCKHIHLGLETSENQLETIVRCERNDPFQPLVRYDPERQIAVIEPFSEKVRPALPGVIVAFGGAKGITFALLERIAKKGSHIYIAGRSPARDSTVARNLATLR
ncbi:MAG: acyltransferase domain-containing protein, partial [Candidatus Riflebacteria bacterium]|nr:acyltransferase domain-containing protein [Candidatus Riflebacteria bacterium]